MASNREDGELEQFLGQMADGEEPAQPEPEQPSGSDEPNRRSAARNRAAAPSQQAGDESSQAAERGSATGEAASSRSSSSSQDAPRRSSRESAPARSRASSGRRPGGRSEDTQLKSMAVPALLAVGGLMLIPGLWSLAILADLEVWRSNKPGAQTVAMAMLLCWPIAGCLIFGAWHYHQQVRKAKANAQQRPSRRG
jgi:hypothetical protein